MLFDLQARGRRGAVKVIYLALAVLMGGGLILFGVGGNVSGGLFDAFNSDNSTSTANIYKDRVAAAEKRTQQQPSNAQAWVTLAKLRYQETNAGNGYDANTQQYTQKGLDQLKGVDAAWQRYIALKPAKVDSSTALLMTNALGAGGLDKPDEAVAAMEYVIAGREPSTGLYAQYAQLAYLAKQVRKGDLASKKAIALAPKDSRETLKSQLTEVKTQATTTVSGATGSSGASGSG